VIAAKLLVLDGADRGHPASIIKDIGRAIVYLKEKAGLAIVLVEQYLDFARSLRTGSRSWIVGGRLLGTAATSMTLPFAAISPSESRQRQRRRACSGARGRRASRFKWSRGGTRLERLSSRERQRCGCRLSRRTSRRRRC